MSGIKVSYTCLRNHIPWYFKISQTILLHDGILRRSAKLVYTSERKSIYLDEEKLRKIVDVPVIGIRTAIK